MTDADFLAPRQNQCILTTHTEVLSRADRGTGIINGNKIVPTDPASLVLTIHEGRIRIAFDPQDVVEDTVTIDEGHATLPRIDIIYRDEAGEAQVMKGTPAVIEDPKNLSDWKSYTSPMPSPISRQALSLGPYGSRQNVSPSRLPISGCSLVARATSPHPSTRPAWTPGPPARRP